ncbi:hypothetical protein Glove_278g38 [Diversispora epigaea]|uniref:Uncharacterized protein n=1 Tax=Diversispora epigaea TaxID=1348612 RepID=A0A397I3P0_9GLOM|nr:hypothetical protein Glove_278g38 [Diversispora epigaea]
MANIQSKIESLEELISKLVAENDKLRRENAEIPELRREKDLLMARIIELEQITKKKLYTDIFTSKSPINSGLSNYPDEKNVQITESIPSELSIPLNNTTEEINLSQRVSVTPASDITDNASNSDICQPISTKTISLEEKEENNFLDLKHKESISNEIKERNQEKKLRDQEFPLTPENSIFNISCEQGLIQEISSSIEEQKHITEISSISGPQKHMIEQCQEISSTSGPQNLVCLYKNAYDAEGRTIKANQEEILCWILYTREFINMVKYFMVNNKVGEKKAKGLVYDLIIKQSSVNFFKRKPSKSFTLITFEYLQHKRNIYEDNLPETKINVSTPPVSQVLDYSDTKINVNIPPISKPINKKTSLVTQQNNPIYSRASFHRKVLNQYSDIYYEYSNEGVDYYGINVETLCPICKLNHEDGEGVEGNYEAGSYYIKCETSEIDMIQYIGRANSADAEIIV